MVFVNTARWRQGMAAETLTLRLESETACSYMMVAAIYSGLMPEEAGGLTEHGERLSGEVYSVVDDL